MILNSQVRAYTFGKKLPHMLDASLQHSDTHSLLFSYINWSSVLTINLSKFALDFLTCFKLYINLSFLLVLNQETTRKESKVSVS
jgi:hypothetical protein